MLRAVFAGSVHERPVIVTNETDAVVKSEVTKATVGTVLTENTPTEVRPSTVSLLPPNVTVPVSLRMPNAGEDALAKRKTSAPLTAMPTTLEPGFHKPLFV